MYATTTSLGFILLRRATLLSGHVELRSTNVLNLVTAYLLSPVPIFVFETRHMKHDVSYFISIPSHFKTGIQLAAQSKHRREEDHRHRVCACV